jgi:PIN domain nuclease of toxin-antitoxin system
MTVLLDASALLAFLLEERGADVVRARLPGAQMSTVNLAEVASRLSASHTQAAFTDAIERSPLRLRKPDPWLAIQAGYLLPITKPFGLSLADRFCIALARREQLPVVTADRDWSRIADAVGVEVIQIRQ